MNNPNFNKKTQNMKVKLFYSYSHKDEEHRNELKKHLATMRSDGLINEWHDRKIPAGDDWGKEIDKNMDNSDIILLLFSPDFIDSTACQKEVEKALKLKEKKGTIFMPIILRECAWKDIPSISNILALPKDGKPITNWDNKDKAWTNVYNGIKVAVEKIRDKITPKLKDEFKEELLHNPIENCTLDKLFVYPDMLKINAEEMQNLEYNEMPSEKLKNISEFKYVLIEGEEQSGKTSLCNMLYIYYASADFYPILINGENIAGKADIKNIVSKQHYIQYESTKDYWSIDKEKRILLIDNIHEHKANHSNFSNFITSIKEDFKHVIIFIDQLSNLSDKSSKHDHFSGFDNYVIKKLGNKKRNEIIRKCISHDENVEFDMNNIRQVARLDKNVTHINSIISTNILPSYPVFIRSIFHIVETVTPQDMHQTSYGHCYHAMITMSLARIRIKPEDIDTYFNFLTKLSYFMFKQNTKNISALELGVFTKEHNDDFDVHVNIETLIKANIIKNQNNFYSFQYIYIYYYFIAKYIAGNIDDKSVKNNIAELMSNIHMKDNSNIIVFVTHHMNNQDNQELLDGIALNAMVTFDRFSESTLDGNEKHFIKCSSDNLGVISIASDNHNIEGERDAVLQERDKSELVERGEKDTGGQDDILLIEIRKSAKNMEIIGQILRNQYGSLQKDRKIKLFEAGQKMGLRFLRNFIELMQEYDADFDSLIQSGLEQAAKEKNEKLSKEQKNEISQIIIAQLSYNVILRWLHKIADSLGYYRLINIADSVNEKTNTTASKLINLIIHAWYTKKLNIEKIKLLESEFANDNNNQAVYILKHIVANYICMHPVDYKHKQKISEILSLPVKGQVLQQIKNK